MSHKGTSAGRIGYHRSRSSRSGMKVSILLFCVYFEHNTWKTILPCLQFILDSNFFASDFPTLVKVTQTLRMVLLSQSFLAAQIHQALHKSFPYLPRQVMLSSSLLDQTAEAQHWALHQRFLWELASRSDLKTNLRMSLSRFCWCRQ